MRLSELKRRLDQLTSAPVAGGGRTALVSDDRDGYVLPANSIDNQVYLGELAQFVAGHTYVSQLFYKVQQPSSEQVVKLRCLTSVQMIGNMDPNVGQLWEESVPGGTDVRSSLKTDDPPTLAVTGGNVLFALTSRAGAGATPEPLEFDVFRFRVYDLGAL